MPIQGTHWLPAAERPAQAGAEERPEQPKHPAGRRLHNAVADLHHAHAGLGGRLRCRLPVRHEISQKADAWCAVLGQHFVVAVGPIDTDGRGGHEHPRPLRHGGQGLGQSACRLDPTPPHERLVLVGEAAGDGRAGQVHHRVDPVERARVGCLGVPRPLLRRSALGGAPA